MFFGINQGWYGKQLATNINDLESGNLGAIPSIFCVFSEKNKHSKVIASKALCRVLKHFEFSDIVKIDESMRQTTSMEYFINWHKLSIDSFFTLSMSDEERKAITVFASFNPNGFIREQSVHMMSKMDGTLPYIILRQNDWVLQIREAATMAFHSRIKHLIKGEIFDALPFIEKISRSNRNLNSEHMQNFFSLLVTPKYSDDLAKGLKSLHTRTRIICIKALLNDPNVDAKRLIIQLKWQREPFIRAMIFKKLCQICTDMHETIKIMLCDKYPANRLLALQYLYDIQSTDILDTSTKYLLDKNSRVRSLASKIIKEKSPAFDLRIFYLNSLKKYSNVAILGIGETGTALDVEAIEIYLNDSKASTVQATLVSLMRLNSEHYKNNVTNMLLDSRASVVKTAQQLILSYNVQDYKKTYDIFKSTPYYCTKIRCMSILFSAPKWERLIYMLEALSSVEENIQTISLESIELWLVGFNKSFIMTSDQSKESIKYQLNKQNSKLPEHIVKKLLFFLE